MKIDSREDFIAALMQMLNRSPNANVMVIVDGQDQGLQVLQTESSFIWSFGVLAATEKMLDERYRSVMASQEAKDREAQSNAIMKSALDTGSGKAN